MRSRQPSACEVGTASERRLAGGSGTPAPHTPSPSNKCFLAGRNWPHSGSWGLAGGEGSEISLGPGTWDLARGRAAVSCCSSLHTPWGGGGVGVPSSGLTQLPLPGLHRSQGPGRQGRAPQGWNPVANYSRPTLIPDPPPPPALGIPHCMQTGPCGGGGQLPGAGLRNVGWPHPLAWSP